jgi:hypothetical protein
MSPAPFLEPSNVRRFLLRFSLSASVLLALYYFPYDRTGFVAILLRLYLTLYAHLAGGVLRVFDSTVHVEGTQILGRMSFDFALSCDGMDVFLLFAAGTFAFPASGRGRALGLSIAYGSLFAINLVRIVSLYFLGVYARVGSSSSICNSGPSSSVS